MKTGEYEERTVSVGTEETTLDLQEGDTYYMVKVGMQKWIDVRTQGEAEVIGRLASIDKRLIMLSLKLRRLLKKKRKEEELHGKDDEKKD